MVIGVVDPDPRVSGSGIRFLREHGVEISVGVERELCLDTNAPFIHRILRQRPLSVVALGIRDSGSGESSEVLADCPVIPDWTGSPSMWISVMLEAVPDADTVLLDFLGTNELTKFLGASSHEFPEHLTVISLVGEVGDSSELMDKLSEVSAQSKRILNIRFSCSSTKSEWELACLAVGYSLRGRRSHRRQSQMLEGTTFSARSMVDLRAVMLQVLLLFTCASCAQAHMSQRPYSQHFSILLSPVVPTACFVHSIQ